MKQTWSGWGQLNLVGGELDQVTVCQYGGELSGGKLTMRQNQQLSVAKLN